MPPVVEPVNYPLLQGVKAEIIVEPRSCASPRLGGSKRKTRDDDDVYDDNVASPAEVEESPPGDRTTLCMFEDFSFWDDYENDFEGCSPVRDCEMSHEDKYVMANSKPGELVLETLKEMPPVETEIMEPPSLESCANPTLGGSKRKTRDDDYDDNGASPAEVEESPPGDRMPLCMFEDFSFWDDYENDFEGC